MPAVRPAGDGVVAAFGAATDALRCAATIAADLPAAVGLMPHCAVHTGEVDLSSGRIDGPTASVVAQLASHAHAGEVLCTALVAELAADAGLHFRDRAPVLLQGAARPRSVVVLETASG